MAGNNLKQIREAMLISKLELAKDADISPLTVKRIEEGFPCRAGTKRKILQALGFKVQDVIKVFGR